MGKEIFARIVSLLESKGVVFEHLIHEHVHTSEDAAKIRGNTVTQAAKAIVFKTELGFLQVVLPGDRLVDYKKIKSVLGCKKIRMATPEESLSLTSCTIGSIPPFGIFWDIPLFLDEYVLDNDYIFFSAGTHYDSIKMKSQDYLRVTHATLVRVSIEKS